jgi:hypothetical protein
MLDLVLVLAVLGLTAATAVYATGCEALLRGDATRKADIRE